MNMRFNRHSLVHLNRSYIPGTGSSLHARARDAAGRYLEERAQWSYFVTATHRCVLTLDESAASLRRWAYALAEALTEHLHLGWCVEEGGRFGRAHWHALVAPWRAPFRIESDLLERLWNEEPTAGGDRPIEIRPYIRGLGGAGYIMKADRWGYGVVCPRQHECRRGCLVRLHPFRH